MRFILLSIFCACVALGRHPEEDWLDQVAPNRNVEDSAFRSGREYQYIYNTQLCTGIPGSSKQHSANRIQAIATVAFKNQNQAVMQLNKVRVGKMNRDIQNPRKQMPFDAFEEVQIAQQLKHKLERPVQFSYVGGLVHDIAFDSQEDPWSANIKRGVLNLLQVNLQQQRRVDTQEEARLTNNPRYSQGNNDNQNFYRVMEQHLEGECETDYTVQQQPPNRHSSGNPTLNVVKSINFEKCNNRPQVKYNFRFADNCETCDPKYNEDEKFLKSSTVAQFSITGTKQAFLIQQARIDSEYVFTPFNEAANTIVTYVNQTMVLIKSGRAQNNPEPQNPIQSDSNMAFTLDWDVAYEKFQMHGDNQAHNQLHQSQQGANKVDLAKQLVQKIAQQMQDQVDENTLQAFTRLAQLMRLCQENELEQICNTQQQQQNNDEGKKLKNIIPQALGACGSKHCTKLLTQKIRQGQISPLQGALAIKGLLHNRVPSKDITEDLIQLAQSDKAQQSQLLKQSAWLAAASLMNGLCSQNKDQLALKTKPNGEKLCPHDQKQKYAKELSSKLREASNWQDKVLMLKAIGNAGLDQNVFDLNDIIKSQNGNNNNNNGNNNNNNNGNNNNNNGNQPMHVRFEAILALHQLKESIPKKIQRILMPVVMDDQEQPPIRSVASYILLQTNPDRQILDQLAHNLIHEKCHQFASFLYSQMQAYANSTNPCEQQLADNMKLSLRHAKKINTGIGYSKLKRLTMQSQKQKVGLDVQLSAVYSPTSSIPRNLGIALNGNALGFWQKYLATLNVYSEGLDPLIRGLADQDMIDDLLGGNEDPSDQQQPQWNRHPRSAGNRNHNEFEQELNDIFSKHLRARPRDYANEYNNEPKAYASAMFKGQTIAIVPITKDLIQQLAQDAGSSMRQVEQKLRQGVQVNYATLGEAHDMHYKIPTAAGMPLTVTIKAPVAWSLKGNLQASQQSPKSFSVQAQLKPSAVAQLLVKVEVWSPIVNTGVKVKAKAKLFTPIDARLEINLATKPISVKAVIKPPTQKRDLIVLESKPVSYTQDWQQYIRSVNEGADEQTIMGEEHNRVNTFKQCVGQQTLGVQICARGQVHNTPAQNAHNTPFAPLSGPNKVVITCQPDQNSPQEIQIKLSGRSQKASGNEMQKPSFSQFSQQNNQDDDDESSNEGNSNEQNQNNQQQNGNNGQNGQSPANRRHNQQGQQNGRNNFQQTLQQYRNYNTKNGYKTQLRLELQAGHNRKMNAEINHLHDLKKRYSQVNMKVQCEQPNQWEACLDAEMMFPETPQFTSDINDQKILANGQLRWGHSCNAQNYIQVTARAQRSNQQTQWEGQQGQFKQYKATNCQNKAWCSPLAQQDAVEKLGQMNKYKVNVQYQNVPSSIQKLANDAYRMVKHQYFWQTKVNQFVQNQQNQINAEITFDAQCQQRANVTVKTPTETTTIKDLPVEQVLVMNQKKAMAEQVNDYLNDQENQGQCSITGKNGWQRRSQVETFDGTTFSAPFTNCWVVLAKDCGSQQPNFVVMARKSQSNNGNENAKEVKIITKRTHIQLTPENDNYDSVKVKVNDQHFDANENNEIVRNGKVLARINKDQSTCQVQLLKEGVDVEFDGYAINIQLSNNYRGQQCGLCGHFDLESADEFRNPDFTPEQDLRQFYMNYMIKDNQCRPPQLNEVCESQECDQNEDPNESSSSSSSQETQEDSGSNEEQETPEESTKVIQKGDQLCFSTKPVPQCNEEDSYPVGVKQQMNVQYACIQQDDESAEQFERQARNGQVQGQALQNLGASFTRTENVPEKCKKYSN